MKSKYTISGTPQENGYVYCPYCGGKIKGSHRAFDLGLANATGERPLPA